MCQGVNWTYSPLALSNRRPPLSCRHTSQPSHVPWCQLDMQPSCPHTELPSHCTAQPCAGESTGRAPRLSNKRPSLSCRRSAQTTHPVASPHTSPPTHHTHPPACPGTHPANAAPSPTLPLLSNTSSHQHSSFPSPNLSSTIYPTTDCMIRASPSTSHLTPLLLHFLFPHQHYSFPSPPVLPHYTHPYPRRRDQSFTFQVQTLPHRIRHFLFSASALVLSFPTLSSTLYPQAAWSELHPPNPTLPLFSAIPYSTSALPPPPLSSILYTTPPRQAA